MLAPIRALEPFTLTHGRPRRSCRAYSVLKDLVRQTQCKKNAVSLIQLVVRSFASLTYSFSHIAPKGASKMLRATGHARMVKSRWLLTYHARMARRAQHLRCSLMLCERSERADNKLDKLLTGDVRLEFLRKCARHNGSGLHRAAQFCLLIWRASCCCSRAPSMTFNSANQPLIFRARRCARYCIVFGVSWQSF